PLMYTPGDNEWTDCSNPLVRLQRLRELVYRGDGTTSRGRTTRPLVSQASRGYPENAIWTAGKVTFVTLHVVGSSDGRSNSGEQQARRAADIDWLRRAFAEARQRGDRGVVVVGHAGLRFERAEGDKGAYESLFVELRNQTAFFSGQVLYLHGDGHTFHDDRPMRAPSGQVVGNFRRVEVYGGGTVRWVKIGIDDESAGVFTVTSPPRP
ncbi:MAG TPA: hypothetical protein VHK88_00060, partial [Aquihabitans sp.]|nr:hypothetical protein [Aquihabitans sp.]